MSDYWKKLITYCTTISRFFHNIVCNLCFEKGATKLRKMTPRFTIHFKSRIFTKIHESFKFFPSLSKLNKVFNFIFSFRAPKKISKTDALFLEIICTVKKISSEKKKEILVYDINGPPNCLELCHHEKFIQAAQFISENADTAELVSKFF
jgi:hypothetical protein